MKGIIKQAIELCTKRKKKIQVIQRFLRIKYKIDVSLIVLNRRLKHE